MKKQVQWIGSRCIVCESCIEVCDQDALSHTAEGIVRNRGKCSVCGRCVEACPSGAMEMLGREVIVDEMMSELIKDRAYYDKSGGGVTLSGGEPTLQPRFCSALMDKLRSQGIHVALDTCAVSPSETYEQLAAKADLILFDVKLLNNADHITWTGMENKRILENLEITRDIIMRSGGEKKLWIRTPLIPGATLTEENIKAIGFHLRMSMLACVDRWELCAFNNLCSDKYDRLDMDWQFSETELMTASALDEARNWAEASGIDPQRIFITGAVKVEN